MITEGRKLYQPYCFSPNYFFIYSAQQTLVHTYDKLYMMTMIFKIKKIFLQNLNCRTSEQNLWQWKPFLKSSDINRIVWCIADIFLHQRLFLLWKLKLNNSLRHTNCRHPKDGKYIREYKEHSHLKGVCRLSSSRLWRVDQALLTSMKLM